MLMKKTENERVHQNIERFFSMKNAFYGLINAFRIVLLIDRKLFEPFFLEWLGKDSIEMRSLFLTFSREILENGFVELMNAF
jgi:hypothetical protein